MKDFLRMIEIQTDNPTYEFKYIYTFYLYKRTKKMEGIVKTANSKGFGFIDFKGIDFFFHHSQFRSSWKELLKRIVSGEEVLVKFDNDTNAPDGPRALNVDFISVSEQAAAPSQTLEKEAEKHS